MNPQVMQMDPRVLQIQQHLQENSGVPQAQGPPGVIGQDEATAQPGQKQRKPRPAKNAVNKLAVRNFSLYINWVMEGELNECHFLVLFIG